MDTNETLENLKTRRSIRAYTDQMPAKELLEKVLEAGTYAPTGKGSQSPIIIAVTDKETRDLLSRLNAGVMGADNDPFYGAPAVLVVLADRNCPTYLYDGSLVMGNLLNAAHAVGLGSCWMGLVEAAAMSGDPQLLELLEQRRLNETHEVTETHTVTKEQVNQTEVNNVRQQVVEKSTEDITEMINRTLARQISTISDRVYGQMERRLRSERARRGWS